VLETFQNIPDKGQRQLLLFADAVRTHKNRGFVAVFTKRRGPLDPAQDPTLCDKPVYLEMRIDEHFAPLAEVLYRVGFHIRMCVLQMVDIPLLVDTPLLFEKLNVLVGFAFVWAEQEQIGFPRTLGIGNHDIRRNGGFHNDPPALLLRHSQPSTFDRDEVLGWVRTRVGHRGRQRREQQEYYDAHDLYDAKGKTSYLYQGTTKTGKPKYDVSFP
jgi:hypothetical protein